MRSARGSARPETGSSEQDARERRERALVACLARAPTTPRTWTTWQGWNVTVNEADSPAYAFGSWSAGDARSHVIVTPTSARIYSATYRKITP